MSNRTASWSRLTVVMFVAAGLFVASAAVAVFSGVSWALAAHDPSVARAAVRDQALQAGRQEIINLNTLDFTKVDQGLNLWEASSTGAFRNELQQDRNATASRITQAKTTTTAQVTDAGITQLDDQANTATVIAVVNLTVTQQGQQPVQKTVRYQAQLAREGPQWKISSLGDVPAG
jgi:Mce-associated membrane protein